MRLRFRCFDHSRAPMPALFQRWMQAAAADVAGPRAPDTIKPARVLYAHPATATELRFLHAQRHTLERRPLLWRVR